jgi:hypothetical protein
MHFCDGKAELFPLGEKVFMPGSSSVEVEVEIFDFIGLRKLNIIDFNRAFFYSTYCARKITFVL